MKPKNNIILATYKVLASETEIIAWDYPPRSYKKAVETIINFLKEHDIPAKRTIAEWPHFTIEYVPRLSEDQKQKIKLMAPVLSTRVRPDHIEMLEGKKFPFDYIVWKLKFDDNKKVLKLVDEIQELADITTPEFAEFKPHVSLVVIEKKYSEQVAQLLPEIADKISKYKVSYKPEQLQFWEKMTIYDIESMEFK